MAIASPVSDKYTTVALLLLTFATGLVGAVSVLVLRHVFVANMTGNGIFLGSMFLPHVGVDQAAVLVAFGGFLVGAILGVRFARHLDHETRLWLTVALGTEVLVLVVLSALAGPGVLDYYDNPKLILIAGLAIAFGSQNAAARQFGVQELSTTVLTLDDRRYRGGFAARPVAPGWIGGSPRGTGAREKLCYTVVLTMLAGAVVGATLTRFTGRR